MRSTRWIFSGLLLLSVALAAAQPQTPLAPEEEPHHQLLFANNRVRVFDVNIPASQEVYVRHQHNFLTVTLADSRVVMWTDNTSPGLIFPVATGDTRFFLGGTAMGVRNQGSTDYRCILVEFLDPQVTNYGYQYNGSPNRPGWDYGSSALAPPVDAQSPFVHPLPLNRAVVRDVRLLSSGQFPSPETEKNQTTRELLIAVSDLDLGMGDKELRKQSGATAWLDRRSSALFNRGTDPARFVVIELK